MREPPVYNFGDPKFVIGDRVATPIHGWGTIALARKDKDTGWTYYVELDGIVASGGGSPTGHLNLVGSAIVHISAIDRLADVGRTVAED